MVCVGLGDGVLNPCPNERVVIERKNNNRWWIFFIIVNFTYWLKSEIRKD